MTHKQDAQLQQLLQNCFNALKTLHDFVLKQQWNKLDLAMDTYQKHINQLRLFTDQTAAPLPPRFRDDFKNLSNQQRRLMRMIYDQMQLASEDIESINKGVKRLQKMLELSTPK